jgi:NitT/TauT family transport system permease protein
VSDTLDPILLFLVFAIGFVLVVTAVVRFSRLAVRKEISSVSAGLLTALFVAWVLSCWFYVTSGTRIEDRILNPVILPSPVEVLRAFPKLHFEQELVRSAWVSFLRVTVGFVLAALVAVTLGVYMAAFKRVSAFFRPLALASAYVPIIVFVPLTLAWWGSGEQQKIGFLFIACFVALLPLVIKDVTDVPGALLDVAMTKGATQWQLVRHVLFPVAAASIWDHMRGVYGVGWGWIILAEVVNGERGLGFLISMSERRGQTQATFAVIIVIVLIAIACDQAWKWGGRALFPYRRGAS